MLMEVHTEMLRTTETWRHSENFVVFTFVVKTHGKQPVVSTSSGMKVHKDYNGQCSKLRS